MAGAEPAQPSRSPSSGPVLQLLASGLQLWIRSQCEAVKELEIQLHGSALNLLRGRLDGVSLMARQVVYQGLEIELVELQSDPLRIQVAGVLRGQPVQLENAWHTDGGAVAQFRQRRDAPVRVLRMHQVQKAVGVHVEGEGDGAAGAHRLRQR